MKIVLGFGALMALVFSPSGLPAQQQEDVWKPLRYFEGSWEGTGKAASSEGTARREYRFVLGGTFLEVTDRHEYAPSANMPKGEVHEEIGFFSYDRARRTFVLRQFHGEGFVNEYALDSLSADGTTIIFVTERVENVPVGWRAMERYEILGPDEFVEMFRLAPPGGEFETYTESILKRKTAR